MSLPASPRLVMHEIGKHFFGVPVLKDIDLEVAPGEVLGLVGENGAGKSTLMSIIGGVVAPTAGTMELDGAAYRPTRPADAMDEGVALIHQELNLFPNLTVAENLFIDRFPRSRLATLDRAGMRRLSLDYLASVGLAADPEGLVDDLSPGERQLVEIARAVGRGARLIIFDEPTTSLTSKETEKLFALIRRLKADGVAIIYISHILNDVLQLCDRVQVLRDGRSVAVNPTRDLTVETMVSMMVGRRLEQLFPPRRGRRSEDPILTVEHLASRNALREVSFAVRRGEILGMFGLMGAGRTEVARALFGLDPEATGEVALNGQKLSLRSARDAVAAGVAFVTENRRDEGLMMDMSVAQNISLVAQPRYATSGGLIAFTRLRDATNRLIGRMKIKVDAAEGQAAKSLSGGNQQKVVIAKWMLSEPKFFILDEPTRGVDVGAKAEIYGLINELADDGAGVLMISSELEELTGVCDRIVVMQAGRITADVERAQFDSKAILLAAFGEAA